MNIVWAIEKTLEGRKITREHQNWRGKRILGLLDAGPDKTTAKPCSQTPEGNNRRHLCIDDVLADDYTPLEDFE